MGSEHDTTISFDGLCLAKHRAPSHFQGGRTCSGTARPCALNPRISFRQSGAAGCTRSCAAYRRCRCCCRHCRHSCCCSRCCCSRQLVPLTSRGGDAAAATPAAAMVTAAMAEATAVAIAAAAIAAATAAAETAAAATAAAATAAAAIAVVMSAAPAAALFSAAMAAAVSLTVPRSRGAGEVVRGVPIRDDIDRTHPGTGRTSAVRPPPSHTPASPPSRACAGPPRRGPPVSSSVDRRRAKRSPCKASRNRIPT